MDNENARDKFNSGDIPNRPESEENTSDSTEVSLDPTDRLGSDEPTMTEDVSSSAVSDTENVLQNNEIEQASDEDNSNEDQSSVENQSDFPEDEESSCDPLALVLARVNDESEPSIKERLLQEFGQQHPEQAAEAREKAALAVGVAAAIGPSDWRSQIPTQLGRITIIDYLNNGGMGVVCRARQHSPDRPVVVKLIRPDKVSNDAVVRFQRECRVQSILHHTNIVSVLEAGKKTVYQRSGEASELHYFAMPEIHGASLSAVMLAARQQMQRRVSTSAIRELVKLSQNIHEVSTDEAVGAHVSTQVESDPDFCSGIPVPPQEVRPISDEKLELHEHLSTEYIESVVAIGIQIARAIDFAHKNSILHCDIKPGNILIDNDGNAHVIDFGLARDLATERTVETRPVFESQDREPIPSAVGIQRESAKAGTISYMAPEQFQGHVDATTDVFSLGATLHHALTFELAYDSDEYVAKYIGEYKWTPCREIRQHSRRIPRDLEAIVCKAIHPNPARRYATAADLADDLERYKTDQLVKARQNNPAIATAKWVKRNRGKAASIAALLVLTCVLARGFATEANLRTVAEERLTRVQNYQDAYNTLQASQHFELGQMDDSVGALAKLMPDDDDQDRRGFEWNCLMNLATNFKADLRHSGPVTAMAQDNQKRWIVTGDATGRVRQFDGKTYKLMFESRASDSAVKAVAISDNGNILAGYDDGDVVMFVGDKKHDRPLPGHVLSVSAAVYIPSSQLYATGGTDGAIHLYSARQNKLVGLLAGYRGRISQLRTVQGKLISSQGSGRLVIWDVENRSIHRQVDTKHPVDKFVINQDMTHIGIIKRRDLMNPNRLVWLNLGTGEIDHSIKLPEFSTVMDLDFDPDRAIIAMSTARGIVRLFKLHRTLKTWGSYRGHSGAATGSLFLRNGLLASASIDGTVRITETDHSEGDILRGHYVHLQSIDFSPNGKLIASAGQDMTIRVWDVQQRKLFRSFGKHKANFRDNGALLSIESYQGHSQQVLAVKFSPDGNLLASTGFDQTIRIWDVQAGKEIRKIGLSDYGTCLVWGNDGKTLYSGGWGDSVHAWNVQTGNAIRVMHGHTSHISCIDISTDGKRLATGSWTSPTEPHGQIRIWDIESGQTLHILKGHVGDIQTLEFHPGGKVLASGGEDAAVHIWDVQSGKPIQKLHAHVASISSLSFSPDGSRLASTSRLTVDRGIRLWDTEHYLERMRINGFGVVAFGAKNQLAFVHGFQNTRVLNGGPPKETPAIKAGLPGSNGSPRNNVGTDFSPIEFDRREPDDWTPKPIRVAGSYRTDSLPIMIGAKAGERFEPQDGHELLVVPFSMSKGQLMAKRPHQVPFSKLKGADLAQEIERRKTVLLPVELFKLQVGNQVYEAKGIGDWPPNQQGFMFHSGSVRSSSPNRRDERKGLAIVCEVPSDTVGEMQLLVGSKVAIPIPDLNLKSLTKSKAPSAKND